MIFSQGQMACIFFFAPIGFGATILFIAFAVAHFYDVMSEEKE